MMAKYRYKVVLTAEYIGASYCIFCGSSSTWADSIVSASAASRRVMKRQTLSNMMLSSQTRLRLKAPNSVISGKVSSILLLEVDRFSAFHNINCEIWKMSLVSVHLLHFSLLVSIY